MNPQGSWLRLTEYSTKYNVSISTLRRKIKNAEVQFQFEDGKYTILDQPIEIPQKAHRPSQDSESVFVVSRPTAPAEAAAAAPPAPKARKPVNPEIIQLTQNLPKVENSLQKLIDKDGSVLKEANHLLNELKKAYTQILCEKEEQILGLREEVTDLKTLVSVLETQTPSEQR